MSDRTIGLVRSEQNLNLFSPDSALKTVGAFGKLGPESQTLTKMGASFQVIPNSQKLQVFGIGLAEEPEISQAM